MKIVIPGGTGQVGTLLARAFHRDGHDVIALGRSPAQAPWRIVRWDPEQLGDWARAIDGADAVINMAGRSVNCRYNAKNRDEIFQSRVGSTRIVGQAIARAKRPPSAWLQASTATIYAHRYDAPNDDESGILGEPRPTHRTRGASASTSLPRGSAPSTRRTFPAPERSSCGRRSF